MATIAEVNNFKCKVFDPETSELSHQELKTMLKQLYVYYPYTKTAEGNREPYGASSDYSKEWFQCYHHLLMLIDMRRQERKFSISIWISILALAVSILGVIIRISTSS
ncbi:TPA: hypothetical protein I7745_23005 [Vibrio vulnificus]|nr:hypothetical protein FORC54_1594 [Vibrio vulnificus]PNG66822.1 hypothetical protein TI06_22640 [Vibrio vulnificus]HAS8120130.1 hypothetical protein [Vibrio vulnificus]HAS8250744.1 hypothetical protein [Vibrio vulnificus]HAS8493027.1 hypothetical protein [Vibrio vulnificus]